jgi:GDP-L-fucose synthase
MDYGSKIFIAGHRGLVGSALCRVFRKHGYHNLVTANHTDVDLTDPVAVKWFFSSYLPEYVVLAAARVGGIIANATQPVEFMVENLRIQDNVITNAKEYHVKKLLFLGSACVYPKHATVPIHEDQLLTGVLEPSNQEYALAKIAGIRLCQAYRRQYGCNFISAMPTNLFGVGDTYGPNRSHVIPGMIYRIHTAKREAQDVMLWGTGSPVREFLYADDLAEACLLLMQHYNEAEQINVSSGRPVVLRDLAGLVAKTLEFPKQVQWDHTKPDGTPVRVLDCNRVKEFGWAPRVSLEDGLTRAYQDFLCRKLF